MVSLSCAHAACVTKPVSATFPILRRTTVAHAALVTLALAAGSFMPQDVLAQATAATAPTPEAANVRYFQIPAGPLSAALTSFATDVGVSISAPPALVQNRSTSGLNGRYSVSEALGQLLADANLQALPAGPGSYVLRAMPVVIPGAAAGQDATLGEVRVTAQVERETATSPVVGWTARRTATSTKTDTDLRETPQAVSIVTRDQMDEQGIQTLSEALRYTSGVRSDAGGAQTSANTLFMRGFLAEGKTYLDGLRIRPDGYFGYFAEEPFALERVEVLKGPASVLYGQASIPGGIVSLVSKRPTEDKRGELELSTGTNNRLQGAVDVSGPLNADASVLYRLVALARDADATIDHLKDKRVYIAPSLTWKAGPRTRLTILPSYQKNWAMYTTNIPYAAVDGSSPYGRVPMSRLVGEPSFDRETTEVTSLGYEFSHEFSDNWRFQQNFRSSYIDNREQYLARASGLLNGNMLNRSYSMRHAYGNNTVVDTRVEGRFGTGPVSHTVLLGLDHARSSAKRVEQTGVASPINIFNPVYGAPIDTSIYTASFNTNQESRQTGLYVQDQLRWKQWVATVGARHDRVSSRIENRLNGAVTSDRDWSASTKRVGLNYLFDNGFTPYVSYSESFNPVTGFSSPARGSTPFDPERGTQKEVGLKYQSLDGKLLSTLSLFDLRRENVSTVDPDNIAYNVQTGEVRSRGAELEVIGQVTRNLKVSAAYSYTDIETTKDNTAANVGKRPSRAPTHMASAWVDYQFREGVFDGLGIGLGARYTGAAWGDFANTFRVPSYTLLDLAMRYDLAKLSPSWKGWSASVHVRNLTDKYYVASCFATVACNLGEGRTGIVKLNYKW
ncbi:TonB-dependent siderophore receptor [Comamonas sp. Tr-654]|uniref:TonB-dependent siderophore receptor n=1 Tax=Comamonas sp. Tr-654 TaxID=2608341 RepID=UPI00351AE5AE|nr:TonB-dependent siderophore receptor [Comamonas sp. Tr-654]